MKSGWDAIDCVYVIGHPELEKNRLRSAVGHLKKHGCPAEKIVNVCKVWGSDLTSEDCFRVYEPYLKREYPSVNFKNRWLLKAEISLVLNFHWAVCNAMEKNYEHILIFECDIYLREDFGKRFTELMEKAIDNKSWSYISLSDGVGTHSEGISFGNFYGEQGLREPHPNQRLCPFRCGDSNLLRRNFFEYLAKHMIPFRDCLDWELNVRLFEYNGKALWAEPHLVEQASQKRLSDSSLRY
jgi:hypothetical protein